MRDGCVRMNLSFMQCKNLGVDYEVVDVESEDGVARSIKHGVTRCPSPSIHEEWQGNWA